MLFYLAFGLLILNRAVGATLLAVWVCLVIITTSSAPARLAWAPADLLRDFVGSWYNLEFGLGLATAVRARHARVPFPRLVAALGTAGLIRSGAAEDAGRITHLGPAGQMLFALSTGLVILGLATAERDGIAHGGRAAVFVGSASHAIYLIHAPVVIGVGSLAPVRTLPALVAAFALATLGINVR